MNIVIILSFVVVYFVVLYIGYGECSISNTFIFSFVEKFNYSEHSLYFECILSCCLKRFFLSIGVFAVLTIVIVLFLFCIFVLSF